VTTHGHPSRGGAAAQPRICCARGEIQACALTFRPGLHFYLVTPLLRLYNPSLVSAQALEQTLREIGRAGTLVKDRGYRQIWRFEHEGRGYYVKFYPRAGSLIARMKTKLRGSPAMREFLRLQWLQKAGVPAPHAVAVLMGFRINDVLGDAVVLDAIEPNVTLDHYLNDLHLRGERAPNHYELSAKVRELVYALGKAKLGHSDLHLGNLLLQDGKLSLLDGHAVRRGGLRQRDVMQLGHSAARYATTGDLARGWQRLGIGPMPDRNPLSPRIWRKFLARAGRGGNRYFGRIESEGWSGVFFRQYKYPYRWSAASRMEIDERDWQRDWPDLLRRMEGDGLEIKKRSKSGDVLAAEVVLAGKPLSVIVKRPKKRYWYRYLNEIGRGGRARRAWNKAWNLVVRNIPTAWPLLLMEKRKFGYLTDAVIVCERVPGKDLAVANLDAMEAGARDMMFRRTGRILRRIEKLGFSHFDAKASNWIVYDDEKTGPQPILVDVDGIRRRQWIALGIQRLLRSMKEHRQYTPADSLALCQGYAPKARLVQEE
jgi:tRNA A-37 threonylcarbamoyl transferase component Bud32